MPANIPVAFVLTFGGTVMVVLWNAMLRCCVRLLWSCLIVWMVLV